MSPYGFRAVHGVWILDGPWPDCAPDPADETLKTGLEWKSRTLMNRDAVRAAAEHAHPGLDADMAQELGLCRVCQRPVWDEDRTTCELDREPIFEEEP